jgi:hypothetical protein
MTGLSRMERGLQVLAAVAVLSFVGCMSDKGTNDETPFEAARYPIIQAHLDSAITQFCVMFEDALAARLVTDTGLIPGLKWPFKLPARRRDGASPLVTDSISWGVGYDRLIDTTRHIGFWSLGRFVDTGVLVHTSSLPASRVRHSLQYGLIDGFGDDRVAWGGFVEAYISHLDSDTASVEAIIDASHSIGQLCHKMPCDDVDIRLSGGTVGKIAGTFDFSTLSATIQGTIKFTELNAILGFDAVYEWEISGAIVNGLATLTISSGRFSQTDTYPLCP